MIDFLGCLRHRFLRNVAELRKFVSNRGITPRNASNGSIVYIIKVVVYGTIVREDDCERVNKSKLLNEIFSHDASHSFRENRTF